MDTLLFSGPMIIWKNKSMSIEPKMIREDNYPTLLFQTSEMMENSWPFYCAIIIGKTVTDLRAADHRNAAGSEKTSSGSNSAD